MASAIHRSLSAWQVEAPLTGPAQQILYPKHCSWSWGDGSVAMRTCCSFRGPGFNPILESSRSRGSNALFWPPGVLLAHSVHRDKQTQTHIHKYSPQSHTHHTLLYLSTPKHDCFTFSSRSFRLNHADSHPQLLRDYSWLIVVF